jgi:hypothetical protein
MALVGLLSLYGLAASGTRMGDGSTISVFVAGTLVGGFVAAWVPYSYVLAKCRVKPIYYADRRYWLLSGTSGFVCALPWLAYRTITGMSFLSSLATFPLIAICVPPAYMLAILSLQIRWKGELWVRLGADFARRKPIIAYFVKSTPM